MLIDIASDKLLKMASNITMDTKYNTMETLFYLFGFLWYANTEWCLYDWNKPV